MVWQAHSHFDCRVGEIHNFGDHAVIFSEVMRVRRLNPSSTSPPLLYFDGQFHQVTTLPPAA
jgi:flavin reductase (DIM6/NTAB) family NADH-FMN oxidoreductase RutF